MPFPLESRTAEERVPVSALLVGAFYTAVKMIVIRCKPYAPNRKICANWVLLLTQ